jgi:hypothetical protein
LIRVLAEPEPYSCSPSKVVTGRGSHRPIQGQPESDGSRDVALDGDDLDRFAALRLLLDAGWGDDGGMAALREQR